MSWGRPESCRTFSGTLSLRQLTAISTMTIKPAGACQRRGTLSPLRTADLVKDHTRALRLPVGPGQRGVAPRASPPRVQPLSFLDLLPHAIQAT